MIRNIIFDMGNVLIRYDPEYFIERAGIENPQEKALLLENIFHSPMWPLQDLGQLTEQGLEEYVLPHLPEHLHKTAHDLIFCWNNPVEPIPGMAKFVADCKKAGLGVYLLSNASFRQPEYWPFVPGNELFDGTMVSAFEGCIKPSSEIFRRLMDRFRLNPDECFFVDDVAENVSGAEAFGIRSFLFQGDAEALRKALAIF